MKIRLSRNSVILLLVVLLSVFALQSAYSQGIKRSLYENRKNILKANLTSLAFKNYQFQAERVLSRSISLNFTYANIPKGGVPLKDQILNLLENEEDEQVINMLNSAQIGYTSYIPEIRFYFGEGFGKGFYIGPFFKHSKYEIENAEILEYERDNGAFETLVTNGNVTSNTFGLLIGVQFNLSQSLVLDWWILGPNFGTHDGQLDGIASTPLSINEQLLLKDDLEDINFPLSETSIEISRDGVEMINKGNWGGLRAGLSLGLRF